jgi:tetratricopeptide (TPR) repeat protein
MKRMKRIILFYNRNMKNMKRIIIIVWILQNAMYSFGQTVEGIYNVKPELEYSQFSKLYADKLIAEWEKKGEYEKTTDWQNRVNDVSRQQKIDEIMDNAVNDYAKYLGLGHFTNKIKCISYDADKEIYRAKIEPFTDIFITVPIDIAPYFGEESLSKIDVEYFIINDKIAIAAMTRVRLMYAAKDYAFRPLYINPEVKNKKEILLKAVTRKVRNEDYDDIANVYLSGLFDADPTDANTYYTYGVFCLNQSENKGQYYSIAVKSFQKAIELDPNNVSYYKGL